MGYRTYIGSISKKEYNKIKSLTKQEMYDYYNLKLDEDGSEPYKGVYEFSKELFCFGKYTDFKPPKTSMKPFFTKKELRDKYAEGNFKIVTPEFLSYLIQNYTNKVQEFYAYMITPLFGTDDKPCAFLNTIQTDYGVNKNIYTFDFSNITKQEQTALFNMVEHIRSMGKEWGVGTFLKGHLPYDLRDTKRQEITTSWKFEYEIFELVRIYKTFDWKKNVMTYYGW